MLRMVRLHKLIGAGKFPNCVSLAKELEVSPKTIQRDIEFMRDQQQMPIAYHQTKFGFYYTAPVSGLPGVEISEGEVAALLIAEQAVRQYRGTALEKPLRSACRKLTEGLEGRVTLDWAEVEAAVSFHQSGASDVDVEAFAAVSEAVLKSRELAFQYLKLGSAQAEARRIRPYHVGCFDGQWYCFGHDLARGAMRTFVLVRMSRVEATAVAFQRPLGFSIARHLEGSFGVFREEGKGRAQQVRIRFDEWAGRLVAERTWHESQKLTRLADGSVELELRLHSLEEIERWILSWGGHAAVLAPAKLRESVKGAARQILR